MAKKESKAKAPKVKATTTAPIVKTTTTPVVETTTKPKRKYKKRVKNVVATTTAPVVKTTIEDGKEYVMIGTRKKEVLSVEDYKAGIKGIMKRTNNCLEQDRLINNYRRMYAKKAN